MIQDLMRKHKTAFLWVILLLVIVPFVYWGGYSGLRRYRRGLEHEAFPPIAVVGKTPVPQQLFRSALAEELNRRRQYQPEVTYRDLHEDGTAMQILNNLVNRTILDMEAEQTGARFPQDFLIEELKKLPQFQKDGKFDPVAWNEWIDARKGHNWNADYAAMEADLRRKLVLERILAPVRVLESDVRREFEDNYTRLRVRYVAIAPKITPTEDELRAFFDSHRDKYQTLKKCKVLFAAVSIRPPKPPIVDELVQRARAGEDFAELAKKYSEGPDKDSGGDMGWRTQSPVVLDAQKPLFALKPGEVSDAVESYGGYYIYKVEEERTDPVKNVREVKARQILIRAKLPEEELNARKQKAQELADKAKESKDLRAAASAMGLETQETDMFSEDSLRIENVPNEDAWALRSSAIELDLHEISDPIEARSNIYVVQVTAIEPPSPLPYEEVRDRVQSDFIVDKQMSESYREQVTKIAQEIKSSAKSINDILKKYEDQGFMAAETDWFTVAEYKPGMGPMWRPQEVFEAVGHAEPGVLGGPIQGFDGTVYFVELLAKEPPDESVMKEKWDEQAPLIRERLLAKARQERIEDYFRNASMRLGLRIDQKVYDEILELTSSETAPESQSADTSPVTSEEGTASQPSTESPQTESPAAPSEK
ncbi:MAG TPA: peptidyl-prolyl cis-trans isomerase [Candidatus Hydrogenedentes bacterium]|nr:peptidyl-prolyl cis-trans isomerase [Candidatus Hydrogenedentota bacterium]HOL76695.1 peptidyl-prolyl cis-trans isomerase [Candidatus Hydrogenedentota bacterium]HPO85344.1 peptidyl-prolyl cis-trans isomerase [Candidatus Hydrogenedentota bacterium]